MASCDEVELALIDKQPLTPEQAQHVGGCANCAALKNLSRSDRPAPVEPPSEIAGLHRKERLGRGGFGQVYRAFQPSLNRDVALKLVPLSDRVDPGRVARMKAEGISLAQLRHPNVLSVFENGIEGGFYYLVTEIADRSLRDALATFDRADVGRCLELMRGVLLGLEAAHAADILHRDIKPENILLQDVDGTPIPKLADFGLARADPTAAASGVPASNLTGLAGTAAYLAPEVWTGSPHSKRSDLFAVGVVFCELLSGRSPFEPESRTPRPLRELAPQVPAPIARWVDSFLSEDPSARPASARAAAERVGQFLAQRRARQLRAAVTAVVLLVLAVVGFIVGLDRERRVSEERLARILQLSDVKRLAELRSEAGTLWPASAERVPQLDDWLARAHELAARLPLHRRSLAAPKESEWQYELLTALVRDLETFSRPTCAAGLTEGDDICSVEQRRAFAREIGARSVAAHAREWAAAVAAIAASPRYRGLRIRPQAGLVPLGPDRESGLWEFADLSTGLPPARVDGRLVLTPESGVVLVLLPGGVVELGAPQTPDDRWARENERPVVHVEIAPFLMSKFEMTQAQWARFTGRNPSQYLPPNALGDTRFTLLNPVESVSWDDCQRVLGRLGLALPSEAQWEYAARAGTVTPWWTGATPASLALRDRGGLPAANLADEHAQRNGGVPGHPDELYEPFDDGWTGHAPVDRFRPNAFGLVATAGNVWEWVADDYVDRHLGGHAVKGAHPLKGGGWRGPAVEARSAYRDSAGAAAKLVGLGVRPMRVLQR